MPRNDETSQIVKPSTRTNCPAVQTVQVVLEDGQLVQQPAPGGQCGQEREIRRLGKCVESLEEKVANQSNAATRLDGAVKSLAETCQRLERVVERLAVPPSINFGTKILDSIIHWGVPLIGGGVIWLIAASGQVANGSAQVAK